MGRELMGNTRGDQFAQAASLTIHLRIVYLPVLQLVGLLVSYLGAFSDSSRTLDDH